MKSALRQAVVLTVLVSFLPFSLARAADTASPEGVPSTPTTLVPGPLRSFLRMAGISQKASPDEVLPLLAREVSVKGYETVTEKSGKVASGGKSTEYLFLLQGYLQQARELQTLAGQIIEPAPQGRGTIEFGNDGGLCVDGVPADAAALLVAGQIIAIH